jgi:Transposase domain (DUF772)
MSASLPPDLSNNPSWLESQLNWQHPLIKLAKSLDWNYFEIEFGKQTLAEAGRPRLATRLVVGLHYLKALYNESDESVVNKWVENPYWQYFCGEQTFQHDLPGASNNTDQVATKGRCRRSRKASQTSVTNGSGSASSMAQ